jgi:hypothetical protein
MIPILSRLDSAGNILAKSGLDLKKRRKKKKEKNEGLPKPGSDFIAHGKTKERKNELYCIYLSYKFDVW